MRIAINGLGRIGRNFLRIIMQNPEAKEKINVVAANLGPARPDTIAHMFKYDTIMGTYPGTVEMKNGDLIIDGHHIKIIAKVDPRECSWCDFDIDWVVDASGCFTQREGAMKHIESGAKKVLITAPAKDEDISIIPGINHELYDEAQHNIVSLGSCTTTAFVTMLKVLNDSFGIEQGFMTTIHSYTNTQVLIDVDDSDLRRARAAALNIIPTTTGAAKVLIKIIPELEGKIDAVAVRVPVAKVSLLDFTFRSTKELSVDAIHNAFDAAAVGSMKGYVKRSMEPLVSSDYSKDEHSVVIDGLLTKAGGNMAKVFGWYDNEWGYSARLKDFLLYVS